MKKNNVISKKKYLQLRNGDTPARIAHASTILIKYPQ